MEAINVRKDTSAVLLAGERECLKVTVKELRQDTKEQHRRQIPISQTKSLTFTSPELLAWIGHPTINRENFRGRKPYGRIHVGRIIK